MFADNLTLFCKADTHSVVSLMEAFKIFLRSSSMEANQAKSQVVMGGCSDMIKKQIITTIGFVEGEFPFGYLGVPITASKLSKLERSMLVDKIVAQIKYWTSRSLSYARGISLVNSTLLGVINFWHRYLSYPRKWHNRSRIYAETIFGGQMKWEGSMLWCCGMKSVPQGSMEVRDQNSRTVE